MRHSYMQDAREHGEQTAARELVRLRIDQTQPIDVFDIIMQNQLWLVFRPLKNVLGTFMPNGVLINSERTLPIQRLTAAHEYGHYLMGHGTSVDELEDITGDPYAARELKEAAARSFAMDFIMPVKLVNFLWRKLDLPRRITPYHAYLLSLHLGTSYQAAVYQLVALEKIAPSDGQTLLRTQPKKIKHEIGSGCGPDNSWADIWPIEQKDSMTYIRVGLDDEICISLPESPSTGYLWNTDQDLLPPVSRSSEASNSAMSPCALLGVMDSEFWAADTDPTLVGGSGTRKIRLRALKPGQTELRLPLIRPWSKSSDMAEEFVLNVRVEQKAIGLLPRQQGLLLAA